MLEADPLFPSYLQHPRFRDIERPINGEEAAVSRSMFMHTPALLGTVLHYPQVVGLGWRLNPNPPMTICTALDDATVENGCVQVIPGSHKLGLLSERGHTITAEQEAAYCADENSVFLEAKAGEGLLIHTWLMHRSRIK